MAFRGTFDYTLDAKNRLTVPAKFRKQLVGDVVVARGIEACAVIWPPDAFEAWTEAILAALGPLSVQGRQFRRVISASAFETEVDGAGRVMVPAKLVDYAHLRKDVVVVGNEDSLEIWDRDAWAAYDADVSTKIPDLTATIGSDAD